jgi:hypothetical protein
VDLQLHVSTAFVKFPSIHNMGGISLFGNWTRSSICYSVPYIWVILAHSPLLLSCAQVSARARARTHTHTHTHIRMNTLL